MINTVRIGIAVLASGSAQRFGENKLLTLFDGKSLIEHCFAAIPAACRGETLTVTCHSAIAALAEKNGLKTVYNEHAAEGISAGIRLAVSEFRDRDGILFLVADQPLLREQTVTRILEAFRERPDAIVCASLSGEPMNPCLFPKRLFPELEALRGDTGGKRIIRAHPGEVFPVPGSPEEFEDCDTPEQLDRLKTMKHAADTAAPLSELLDVKKGITAVIGSGGKTALLSSLADELPGTVILTTTTHFFPFSGMPTLDPTKAVLPELLRRTRVICCAAPDKDGKLKAPVLTPKELSEYADYVLVEADGSKGLPIKAHRAQEPVIPAGTGQVITVIGLSGIGKPIETACHCPELYAALAECAREDTVSPENLAKVLIKENLSDRLFLNQAELHGHSAEIAGFLRKETQIPVIYGSLKERWAKCSF